MVPSALALAALGAAGGYALASGSDRTVLIEVIRYLLFVVPILCIVGPLFLPAGDRTNPVRMLLLPISRSTMYVAQTASAFGDPWILLLLPGVLGVPLGLAAGGAIGAATLAVAGGALLLLVVLAIASLAASILHLAVRNRRRGELLALFFIMVLPLIGLVPMMMSNQRPRDAQGKRLPRPAAERVVPGWAAQAGEYAAAALPTELYIRSTRQAAVRVTTGAATPLLWLAAMAWLLHALSMRLFNIVLDSPGSTGPRRTAPMRAFWGRKLPLLSAPASAVALAQVRLATRTPRGRSIMVSPLLILVIFGMMMYRGGGRMDMGPFDFQSGLGLAAFVSVGALMSILPIAMNQFAIDKAGLTLALLSPITDRDYLVGKAVGNSLITALPTLVGVMLSAAVFPGGSLALWLCIPLVLLSISFIVAPVAAILSAIFPRVVELNSIGRGSNAHGLAGLLGFAAFLGAGLPSILLLLLATRWLERPSLAPVFLSVWCVVSFGIGYVLFIPARKIFAQRRENFTMLV
jgi:hypothetical protein